MERTSPLLNSHDPLPQGPIKGGTETILVLEPDQAAQAAVAGTLQSLGYRVLPAGDAPAALEILRGGVHVDLVFTDSALPGPIRSSEFATMARDVLPGLALLITVAAPHAAAAQGGPFGAGAELLTTPYRKEELAHKVRHALGNQQQVNVLASALREAKPGRPRAPAVRLRVLLVEDQDALRDTTRQLLELLGCEVEAVASAEAADSALRRSGFDVLLSDISLPGRSGLELARDAARLQPGARVVLSSGYGQPPIGGDALHGLRARVLPKPYGAPELEALLRELQAG